MTLNEYKKLARRAVELKHDLIKAGLIKTGHLMEPVVTEVGYEIESKIKKPEKKKPFKPKGRTKRRLGREVRAT